MKVLFCIPKSKDMYGIDPAEPDGVEGKVGHPHMGTAYLSAFLKQYGMEVQIYDHGLTNSIATLRQLIAEFQPDVVGTNGYSYSYTHMVDLIGLVRGLTSVPLVVGGPHVSATKEEILLNTRADFAVKGEGEHTLLEFLRELEFGAPDWGKVEGLLWRRDGEVVENPDRPFIKDLDSLPYPDFGGFDLAKYHCSTSRTLPIISSRGCPFGCTFCSVRLSMGRVFRARSAENFVEELAHWKTRGWERFEFDDDCFSANPKRAKRICELICKRNLDIKFDIYNGIRVDCVDPELLKALKRAGCSLVSYGLEAANAEVLKNIRKGVNLEQVRNAVRWTKEAGLRTSVNFIIGHQGETYQKAKESLEFAKTLDVDFVNFYNLVPYPGTETYEWVKQHGRFLVPEEEYLRHISYRDNKPIFETDEFTAAERMRIIKESFALYHKTLLRFRLGRRLGYLAYLLICTPIGKWGIHFALENRIGKAVYRYISRASRQ
jgi:radical SAM superfamily enzyme YgiQ (UPF0313 family)